MVVFVTYKNALTRATHSMLVEVLLKSSQTGDNRRIFLRLSLFGTKSVVAQWIQGDCLGLIGIEIFWEKGTRWVMVVSEVSKNRFYELQLTGKMSVTRCP